MNIPKVTFNENSIIHVGNNSEDMLEDKHCFKKEETQLINQYENDFNPKQQNKLFKKLVRKVINQKEEIIVMENVIFELEDENDRLKLENKSYKDFSVPLEKEKEKEVMDALSIFDRQQKSEKLIERYHKLNNMVKTRVAILRNQINNK